MCGRYNLRTPPSQWQQQFLPEISVDEMESQFGGEGWQPRYNIAPTTNVLAITQTESTRERRLSLFRWGLVPFWADDLSIGNRMINARSETVDEKKSFQRAFAKRRCLILADGYYEWKKQADGKQPYHISAADGRVLAMAGLWEVNRKAKSEPIETCTILTTAANETTREIHDRMPVFLDPQQHDRWLDRDFNDSAAVKAWLRPASEDLLTSEPVSRYVNNARHQGPECIEPI